MERADNATELVLLVYSDDRLVRSSIVNALGVNLAPELPRLKIVECATEPMLMRRCDEGGLDLVILDGEAAPAGGMGVARQLKDEIDDCPPTLVIVGRAQDAWLATWSFADGVVAHPIDPVQLAEVAAGLLRNRIATGAAR